VQRPPLHACSDDKASQEQENDRIGIGAAVPRIDATPSKGNRTSGVNAVAGIGNASVIHHAAISKATLATRQAASGISAGGGMMSTTANAAIPIIAP
jgi:hypothetical protein